MVRYTYEEHWRLMKQIQLSVKEHVYTDSYKPTFGHYDYVKDFDFENMDDIDEIYSIVNMYVHTYYTYNNNRRKESSFEETSSLFLDFDTKNTSNHATITEFINSDLAKQYSWFLYTSKSHTNENNCFHVVLPLDEKITDIAVLRSTYTHIYSELLNAGITCDTKIRDGARVLYPSINTSKYTEKYWDTHEFEYHNTGEYISYVEPMDIVDVISTISTETPVFIDINSETHPYVSIFNSMSRKSKYTYMKSIAVFMNNENKKHGYRYLNYNRWIAMGYIFYSVMGYTYGKKLFRILSFGYPGDTIDSIDSQFECLSEDNMTVTKNLDVIMKMSSSLGYKHGMYLKYYFMRKHQFSTTQKQTMYNAIVRKVLTSNNIPYNNMSDVKLYDFSHKKHTRVFLIEVYDGINTDHYSVSLSKMMDISADMLGIPREFITTSITKSVIRKYINTNGIFDMSKYIKQQVKSIINNSNNDIIRVSDVNEMLSDIREYAPTTIYSYISNKNIEKYMFELGVYVDKKKRRFKDSSGSRSYMSYTVNESALVISTRLYVEKKIYYIDYTPYTNIIMNDVDSVVMKC